MFWSITKISSFYFNCLKQLIFCLLRPHSILYQIRNITFLSLPLTLTVAVFTGAIIAIQSISLLGNIIPLQYIGTATQKSILLDLGPVLTAIIVSGKISGSITAEIGTMAISEQLDAMRANNLDPFKYLIVPRLLAGLIALPLLIIVSATTGILGSLLVVLFFRDLSVSTFLTGLKLFFENKDVIISLVKSVSFGFLITSFGCYFGYYCRGGPDKIGKISQLSVMSTNIAILFSSYIISLLFL